MNANAQLWVEALRSGEYKQTRGILADGHGYCCLGVACEVYIKAGNPLRVSENEYEDVKTYDGEQGALPKVVQEWLKLKSRTSLELAAKNDKGTPFNEIADLIVNTPQLFEEYSVSVSNKGFWSWLQKAVRILHLVSAQSEPERK